MVSAHGSVVPLTMFPLLAKLGTLFGHCVGKHVGHHVGHLVQLHVGHHVHLHVGRHISHRNILSTLCEVSETLTEWKAESVMDDGRLMDRRTGVGVRDTCVSKNLYYRVNKNKIICKI